MSSAPRPKRFYRDMTPTKAAEIRRLYFVDRLKQHEIGKLYGLEQSSIHIACRPSTIKKLARGKRGEPKLYRGKILIPTRKSLDDA